uniref:Uncharacterized protein n=1 Tax=Myoviridae sp. ctUPB15 TaxID=2825116 RepID=A0A8S5PWG1_9CAUD|nr:MAG TPA: hypothetical protein [Myoviridae sp. ctUPB15]DAR50099.1 MAG TPA: hypothetical protein [Caudoviricetes sp.]
MTLLKNMQGVPVNHGLKENPENTLFLTCEYQWFFGKFYVN